MSITAFKSFNMGTAFIEEKKDEIFSFIYRKAKSMDGRLTDAIDMWAKIFNDRGWLSRAETQQYKNALYIGRLTGVSREPDDLGILMFNNGEIQIGYWKYGKLDCGGAVIYKPDGIILVADHYYNENPSGWRTFIYHPDGKREFNIQN